MNVFEATIELTRASLRVLRRYPRLMAFPALMLASIILFLLIVTVLAGAEPERMWLWILVAYFGSQLLANFFETALTQESLRSLRGESPAVGGGLAAASGRLGAVCGYTFIAATVGLLITVIGRSSSIGVRIARQLVATGWSLVSFFALPVLVQEKRGGYQSVMRSGRLFRKIWGETTLAEVGLRAIFAHLTIILGVLLFWLIDTFGDSALSVLAIIALWTAFVSLCGALDAVYRSALYIFAAEGVVPAPFDTAELNAIWRVQGDGSADEPRVD